MSINIPRGLLWIWLAGVVSAPAATTLYVSPFGTNDVAHGYPDWAGAATNIQAALDKAVANDIVWVTNETYNLIQNLAVTNAVFLRSWHDGELDSTNTILNGQGVTRCLYVADANALVAGFLVTNGNGVGHVSSNAGGGVYMSAGVVSNCVVSGNIVDYKGGGIYAAGSACLIDASQFVGNFQTNTNSISDNGGGGVYLANSGRIRNSHLRLNEARVVRYYTGGGGVYLKNPAEITGCTVISNKTATMGGGVILVDPLSGAVCRSNDIFGNAVTVSSTGYRCGGGVGLYRPRIGFKLESCRIVSNTCSSWGSGIGIYDAGVNNTYGVAITNCTISYNTGAGYAIGRSWGGDPGATNYLYDYRLLNSTLEYNTNTTGSGGGAVGFGYGGMWIESCVIRGNEANSYGGVYFFGATTNAPSVLRNCLIAGNVARGAAVGGCNTLLYGWIDSCTIVSNRAATAVGGVYLPAGSSMSNTICYYNSAPSHPDWTGVSPFRLGNNCLSTNDAAQWPSNITDPPLFVDVNTYNYRLAADSPCIDAGANQVWMLAARDLDVTNARILGGRVDMGAYEYTNGSLSCTFIATPLWALAPSTNTFTAFVEGTNQDSLYYRWDFTADGTVETEGLGLGLVTNVYTNAGYYSVALTASNAAGEVAGWTNVLYLKAGPVTYYVATNGGNVFPYTNWDMAASNAIQPAVDAANNQDTVILSNGTYVLNTSVGISTGVLVRGLGGWADTIIDGNGATRCFDLNHTNAVLAGVTVTNGRAAAGSGGGVYINLGGIISNCVIRNCRADRDGGGAYLNARGLLRNCLIVTNVSSNGGGVCSYQTGLVQNCTIVGNVATNWSGGIYASSTGGVFQNCIIYSNYADSGIGPNWCTNNIGTNAPTRFVFTNCCTFPTNDLPGLNNIAAEPGFIDFGGGNFRLGSSSPGVDAGANQDEWMLAGIDLDGQSRIFNTVVDIGAFERSLFDAAAAPANVQASDGTYVDQVRVTWETNACTNATGYQVFRSLAADPAGADQLSDVSDASYADVSATNGVLYYYWVRATNAYAVSDLSASNTGWRALDPPTGVTASDGSYSGKVVVTWATNVCTNAAGYIVWRNTAGDLTSATRLVGVAGTNYDDTSAISNVSYYYWIQATNTLSQTNISAGGPDTGYWAQWYYVATNGDDGASGIDWSAPLLTISNGVARAQRWMGGGVLVSNGEYTVTNQMAITNGITVAGVNGREVTFINGNYPATTNRAFWIQHVSAVVDGFTITNCVAGYGGGGGAVYIATNGRVVNCVLAFNQSTNNGNYATGGGAAFLKEGGLLTNCIISNNTANFGVGGGAHLLQGGVLSNCTLVANSASNASGWNGGGAWLNITAAGQTIRVSGCVFSNNVVPYWGGGLYLRQTAGAVDAVLIDDCLFVTNIGLYVGGGLGCDGGGIVSNCTLLNNVTLNTSYGYGAGASLMKGARIVNCTNISGNSGYLGGGIYLANTAQVENCRVMGNRATRGGGIYMDGAASTNITVAGCVIANNTADTYGGGIYGGTGGTISNCVIAGNIVTNSGLGYGGGVYVSGSRWVIRDCPSIYNNQGARQGGGIYMTGASVVSNCVLSNNVVIYSGGGLGGGLYLAASARVTHSLITSNSAVAYNGLGGGVYLASSALVTNCTIFTNKAYNGGGICGAGYVRNCTNISYNVAMFSVGTLVRGGGLFMSGGMVADCIISNNVSGGRGGGLTCMYGNNLLITNCVFDGNYATDEGGGVEANRPGITLRNCLITRNASSGNAGGVELTAADGFFGRMENCTIVSNYAAVFAGGLWDNNYSNALVNCIIYSNVAGAAYPNIWLSGNSSLTFTNCCTPDTNGLVGSGNITNYPKFLNPAVGNWRLGAGSLCINRGLYEDWMAGALDKDGNVRILGGTVDLGAYEYPLYPQVSPLGITNTLASGASTGTLVEVWSSDTNADLIYAASSTNAWIALGVSNGVIAVNTTNTLWVTNDSTGLAAGTYTGSVVIVTTNSLSALYPPDTQTVTVIMTILPPGPPANVQATDGAYADKVVVTWDTNLCTNATGYAVWRSIAADTNSASILSAASDTSYIDTSAANGVLYYYWVQATNAGSFSDLSESNTGYRALAPPTGVTASDGSYSGKVVVTWSTNACINAAGYTVWRNTASDISTATRLVDVAGTNYDDASAMSNVSYYYWIQATNTLSQTNTSAGGPDTGYWALTYYVATNGSDASPGLDWTAPAASISNAVAQAQRWATGLVLVSNGTYTVTLEVAVTNSIRVRSWNAGAVDRENTLISGGGAVRGFNVNHAGAVLEGLTVTNGAALGANGGGIELAAGLVTNCVLAGNLARYGGGIHLGGANATLKNTLLVGNVASGTVTYYTGGGGVYMDAGLVTNCVISNNAGYAMTCGGGAWVHGGTLTDSEIVTNMIRQRVGGGMGGGVFIDNNAAAAAKVVNCTIRDNGDTTIQGGGACLFTVGTISNCHIINNYAGSGGGIWLAGAVLVLDSVISNNTAAGAGGIFGNSGTGTLIRNCQIVANKATAGSGGGVDFGQSQTHLLMNTLLAGNSCTVYGGGVYTRNSSLSSCTVVSNYAGWGGGICFNVGIASLTNCIVFSNKTGAAWTDFYIGGSTTVLLYNCCTPVTNTSLVAENCVTNAPQYVSFPAGNFRLGPASPCINNGVNEGWMDTALDLDWRPRIRYGRVDMGCYEYLLNVKVNGIPIDRILRLNGVNQNRIFRISE